MILLRSQVQLELLLCVSVHSLAALHTGGATHYLTRTTNKNDYYTSVIGRQVRKHRQNQLKPQEILGVLDKDLCMAVDQTLSPPRVRVWLVDYIFMTIVPHPPQQPP